MPLDTETKKLAGELIKFMQNKFGFNTIPKIKFINSKSNSENILGKTGAYDPDSEEIIVYVSQRHPKDILRSLAHELTHHVQKCEGALGKHDMSSTADPNYIMHDDYLKGIEADAFERGNIAFREWEATKKGGKLMGEEKKMSKPEIKAKHKKAKEAMPSFVKQYGKEKGEKIAYATAMSGKMDEEIELEEAAKPDYIDLDKDGNKKEPMKKAAKDAKKKNLKEETETNVNEALKNSHFYVPEDRALQKAYNMRDERIFVELMKKFKIGK